MDSQCDLITGGPLPDHEDEYVRQKVEALLVSLGYGPADVWVDHGVCVEHQGQPMRVSTDLVLLARGEPALVLRCARGSIVSRERETVAAARLLAEAYIPLAAVSNGEEAELLDTRTGKVIRSGPGAIPAPAELAELAAGAPPHRPSEKEHLAAARVYHAYSFIQCPGQCTV